MRLFFKTLKLFLVFLKIREYSLRDIEIWNNLDRSKL